MPQRSTSTTTCPLPGSGAGRSTTSSLAFSQATAFMRGEECRRMVVYLSSGDAARSRCGNKGRVNAFAHMHDTGRARRPMAFRRRGRQGPVTPASLPYGIQTWDTGPRAHLVVASGELDLHAAGSMRDALMSLVARGHVHLVIDLSAATFIDSAMIGVLAGHIRHARGEGGSVVIACSNENVLRTLEVAGIVQTLQIVDSVSDALVESVALLPDSH